MNTKFNQIIGLTGSIASGKSTASQYLAAKGISIVDADQIVRNIFNGKDQYSQSIQSQILQTFNTLNRQELRSTVFQDSKKRAELETIIHPAVRKLATESIDQYIKNSKMLIIYEAPLLLETLDKKTMLNLCNKILLITTEPHLQIERMQARDKTLDLKTTNQIIESQMSQDKKISKATWIIENNGSVKSLEDKLEQWLSIVCSVT